MSKKPLFNVLAKKVSHAAGKPVTFILAVLIILAWAATGPLFAESQKP